MSTLLGIPTPAHIDAPRATGRYHFRLDGVDHLDVPAVTVTLADIRAALFAATEDGIRAVRDGRAADAEKHLRDAQLLGRALRRFEVQQERARLAGGS